MTTLEREMTQHNLYNVADSILNTLDPGYVFQADRNIIGPEWISSGQEAERSNQEKGSAPNITKDLHAAPVLSFHFPLQ